MAEKFESFSSDDEGSEETAELIPGDLVTIPSGADPSYTVERGTLPLTPGETYKLFAIVELEGPEGPVPMAYLLPMEADLSLLSAVGEDVDAIGKHYPVSIFPADMLEKTAIN